MPYSDCLYPYGVEPHHFVVARHSCWTILLHWRSWTIYFRYSRMGQSTHFWVEIPPSYPLFISTDSRKYFPVQSVIHLSWGIWPNHVICSRILFLWWFLVCEVWRLILPAVHSHSSSSNRFSLGVLQDPSKLATTAFPTGAAARDFNTGVEFYFTFWVSEIVVMSNTHT